VQISFMVGIDAHQHQWGHYVPSERGEFSDVYELTLPCTLHNRCTARCSLWKYAWCLAEQAWS